MPRSSRPPRCWPCAWRDPAPSAGPRRRAPRPTAAPPEPGRLRPAQGRRRREYQARRRALMEQIKAAEAGPADCGRRWRAERRPGGPGRRGRPGRRERARRGRPVSPGQRLRLPDRRRPARTPSLILRPERARRSLYLPPRNRSQERLDRPQARARARGGRPATGFARVESSRGFLADLFRAIGDPRTGGRAASATSSTCSTRPRGPARRRPAAPARAVRPRGGALGAVQGRRARVHEMRKVKSEAEVALLRRAVAVTADAHARGRPPDPPGRPRISARRGDPRRVRRRGADRAGLPLDRRLGAELDRPPLRRRTTGPSRTATSSSSTSAASTRGTPPTSPGPTRPSGRFTPRQREVYQLVLDAQSAAVADFKPGVSTIASLNRTVRDVFRESPLRARDEEGSSRRWTTSSSTAWATTWAWTSTTSATAPSRSSPARSSPSSPASTSRPKRFGVRIEDDYRVTKDGLEKLSRDIPVDPDEIERPIAQARGGNPA